MTDLPFKIPLVKRRFHNSQTFPAEHMMATQPLQEGAPWPENVSYFGNPGEQEDLNWDRLLIQGESFPITVEEARRAWPDHYQEYYLEEEQGYRTLYALPLCLLYISNHTY